MQSKPPDRIGLRLQPVPVFWFSSIVLPILPSRVVGVPAWRRASSWDVPSRCCGSPRPVFLGSSSLLYMIVSIKVGVILPVRFSALADGQDSQLVLIAHAAIPWERLSDNQRRILPADQYRRLLIRTVG